MDIHKAFRVGAQQLAANQCRYTSLHKTHGIEEHHWDLLTQSEYWSPDQARAMRSILASVCEASMTIAGMPAVPLPGQYVAAVIAEIVAPVNRLLACVKAPDTFDAYMASGLERTHEVKPMSREQLQGLVIAYSGGLAKEPNAHKLPSEIKEQMKEANKK